MPAWSRAGWLILRLSLNSIDHTKSGRIVKGVEKSWAALAEASEDTLPAMRIHQISVESNRNSGFRYA